MKENFFLNKNLKRTNEKKSSGKENSSLGEIHSWSQFLMPAKII
jgi:hypothetical protein